MQRCREQVLYPANVVLPDARTFAQRALASAASLARTLGLIFLRPVLAGAAGDLPLTLAHRALWAAAILARAAGDRVLRVLPPMRSWTKARGEGAPITSPS